jgi:hypothetical protein
MHPIIIIPPNTMSEADIKMLRDNELCVVVAKNPAAVKFLDPIPAAGQRTQIEAAAIKLSRILLNGQWANISNASQIGRSEFARLYVELLTEGTALDRNGSREEQERRYFGEAKLDELRRLAREEAKAERAAAKKAKVSEAKAAQ